MTKEKPHLEEQTVLASYFFCSYFLIYRAFACCLAVARSLERMSAADTDINHKKPDGDGDRGSKESENVMVVKWDQGHKTAIAANKIDRQRRRRLVVLDLLLYSASYLVPFTAPLCDRFAQYRLSELRGRRRYMHPALNGFRLSVILESVLFLLVVFFTAMPVTHMVSGFELYGPLVVFVIRALMVAYMEALNDYDHELMSPLHLDQLRVTFADGRVGTAAQFHAAIMAQSHFDARIQWNVAALRRDIRVVFVASVLSSSLVLVCPTWRTWHYGRPFGQSVIDVLVVVCSGACLFGMGMQLFRSFLHSYSLYRSMTSTMRRLRQFIVPVTPGPLVEVSEATAATTAATAAAAPEDFADLGGVRQRRSAAAATSLSSLSSSQRLDNSNDSLRSSQQQQQQQTTQQRSKIDLSVPQNIKAFVAVRHALDRRQDSLQEEVVILAATALLLLLLVTVGILVLNIAYAGEYDVKNKLDLFERLVSLSPPNTWVLTYIFAISGILLVILAWVCQSGWRSRARVSETNEHT